MTTKEFMQVLQRNRNLKLKFVFNSKRALSGGYHLTEVKNVRIEAVDCGGAQEAWRETVVQLWLPPVRKKDDSMTTGKALGILEKVQELSPMDFKAPCRFEAEEKMGTAVVYDVGNAQAGSRVLTIRLTSQKTQCKAQKRDATACGGVAEESSRTACC